jgi:hypothetical protein
MTMPLRTQLSPLCDLSKYAKVAPASNTHPEPPLSHSFNINSACPLPPLPNLYPKSGVFWLFLEQISIFRTPVTTIIDMSISGFNKSKKQKKSNTARVLHVSHKPNKQITPNNSDTPRTRMTKNTQYKARRLNKSKQQARLKDLQKPKKSSRIRHSSKHGTYVGKRHYPLWNPIYWPCILYKRYGSISGPLQVQRPEVDTTAQNPSLVCHSFQLLSLS